MAKSTCSSVASRPAPLVKATPGRKPQAAPPPGGPRRKSAGGGAAGPKGPSSTSIVRGGASSASGSKARTAVVVPKPGDVFLCEVCEASSKDSKWAASEEIQSGGKKHIVPIGPICDECWHIGVKVLGYGTSHDFTRAMRERDDLQGIVTTTRKNMREAGSAGDIEARSVKKHMEIEVEVEQQFRGYSDLSLRKLLEAPRLTKLGMKDIPEVGVPSRTALGEQERLYVFPRLASYPADDEGLDLKIRCKVRYDLGTEELSRDRNLHETHADDLFARGTKQMFKVDGFGAVLSKKLQSMDEFIKGYDGGGNKRKRVSGVDSGAAARLQGNAASEFALQSESLVNDLDDPDAMADLSEQFALMQTPKRAKGVVAAATPGGSLVEGTIDGSIADDDEEDGAEEGEPSSGDWLAHWKAKLPLRSVMTGVPKGRSIRALRQRVQDLCGVASTRSVGALLQQYHERVKIANQWRGGGCISALSDADLADELKKLCQEDLVLPAEVGQALVQRSATRAAAENKWRELLTTLLPFCEDGDLPKFNAKVPLLRELPRTRVWKLACFQTSLLHEQVCSRIYEGEPRQAELLQMSMVAIELLEAEDPLLMDKASAVAVANTLSAFKGLHTLCELPFCAANIDIVRSFCKKAEGDPVVAASLPMDVLRDAINESEWFSAQRDRFLEAAPTLVEKEAAVLAHKELLETFDPAAADADAIEQAKVLKEMSDDLIIITAKVKFSALDVFCRAVFDSATAYLEHHLKGDDKGANCSEAWVGAALSLAQSVSVAFPLEEAVSEWMGSLAELKNKSFEKECLASLMQKVDALAELDLDDEETSSELANLEQEALKCKGVSIPSADFEKVEKLAAQLLGASLDADVKVAINTLKPLKAVVSAFLWRHADWGIACAQLSADISAMAFDNESAGDEQKTCCANFDKAVEDLRVEKGRQLSSSFDEKLRERLQERLEATYLSTHTLKKNLLQNALDNANTQAEAACKFLRVLSAGSNDPGVSWWATLPPAATIDATLEVAQAKGLMGIDIAALKKLRDDMSEALKAEEDARARLGDLTPPQLQDDAKELIRQSIMTEAEHNLLQIHVAGDSHDRRSQIQKEIKTIRSHKLQEKKELPPPLYKWAYAQLTK